ncbi:MAG: ABC transporter ATP-binding protein [Bradymonadaceae bacterium]
MLVRLDNVQKYYGDLEALAGVTAEVDEGTIGLLGPNGAGKTTLLQLLLGLLEPTRGSIEVLGRPVPSDARSVRRRTGYMPETDCYVPYMTAVDFLTYNGRLAGMPKNEAFQRAHQTLYYVGLEEARYRDLGGFSAGMKQRVKLAQGLVHGPDLLFLDEPTSGLDPQGRDEMLDLIRDIAGRGVNVVLSSHVLHEVEAVCDEVLMLNEGELVHYGAIDELKAGGDRVVEIRTRDEDDALERALTDEGYDVVREGLHLEVHLDPEADAQKLLEIADRESIQIRHFFPAELTLESAFLELLEEDEAREQGTRNGE